MEVNLNKLRWRARRGTKELDFILQGFLNEHFQQLSPAEQQHFAELLEQADPDITDWLNGIATPTNPDLVHIIALIQQAS